MRKGDDAPASIFRRPLVSAFRRPLYDCTILLEFYKGLCIRITSSLILIYSKKYINRGVVDSEEG